MKHGILTITVLASLALLTLGAGSGQAQEPAVTVGADPAAPIPTPQTVATAFTYQGRLLHNNAAVNATCDFEFRLFPARAGGSQVGATLPVQATVKDGLFSARLDFGSAAFSGEERWLEISVTCPAAGPSGVLGPRQELTAAPYALGLRPGATITDAASTVQLNRAWTNSPDGPVYQAALHAAVIGGAASFNYGVYGSAATAGVYGYSADASGRGVHGQAAATSGAAYGVVGISASPDGAGSMPAAPGSKPPTWCWAAAPPATTTASSSATWPTPAAICSCAATTTWASTWTATATRPATSISTTTTAPPSCIWMRRAACRCRIGPARRCSR